MRAGLAEWARDPEAGIEALLGAVGAEAAAAAAVHRDVRHGPAPGRRHKGAPPPAPNLAQPSTADHADHLGREGCPVRRLVAILVAALLVGVWAVVPGRSAPVYGPQQTVVVAHDISDAVSLDPQLAYEFASTLADHWMYSTLVQFPVGDLTHVVPEVASSWDVSKDATTYTFHLRHGIKFSSGDQLTAADVIYTFERVVNLPKDPASWLITQMGIHADNVDQAVTAPDPYTVVVKLPKPFSPGAFLAIMANPVAGIVDSKTLKTHVSNGDWGSAWLNDHSAGSGPYELVKWTRLVTIELTANPHYNVGPAPTIKRIIWPNIMESTVQQDMLRRGDADIALGLTASQLAALRENPGYYVAQTPDLSMTYVGMDVKNVPAFGKVQVRQAVKWAIDYQGIIRDLLAGNGIPLQGVIPKGLFGYDPSVPYHHDPAKAKGLLQEAGYPNGFTAEMLAATGQAAGGVSAADLAAKIKNDLAQVGITVNVRQVASDQMYSTYRAQKSQMVLANWSVDYPDPDDFAKPFGDYTQKSLAWRLQWYDDPLAKLVDQAGDMQNTPERAALYKRINDIEMQDGPFAMLYQPMYSIAASKRIQNLKFDPVNGIDFATLIKK
jgi:peptide/nickel transport system substrate-binding protein